MKIVSKGLEKVIEIGMSSRKINTIRNAAFGFIKYIVTLLFPFIIRSIIIYSFGEQYSGLGNLFSSILSVLSLSELGFSSAIVYGLYEPVAKNDNERICSILRFYRNVYKKCGLTILILGLIVTPFLKHLIKGQYPDDINIYIIFLILLLNTAVSYILFGYREVLLVANQRNDVQSKIFIIISSSIYILQIIVIIFIKDYYCYTLLTLLGTICINFATYLVTKRMYPQISCKGELEKSEKTKMYKSVMALFGHQIDMVVINAADNVVISMFLGLSAVTVYNNYTYVTTALMSFMFIFANAIVASVGNSLAVESVEKNYMDFKFFSYFFGLINVWSTAMLISLFQPFMRLWMGEARLYGMDTMILVSICFYVRQARRVLLTYKNALGDWAGDWLKPYVASLVNIVLNVVLVKIIDINGVMISTIISMLFIEMPWETKVIFNGYFKVHIKFFFKEQIRLAVKLIIVVIPTYLLSIILQGDGIYGILIQGTVCCFASIFMLFMVSFRDKELKNILGFLKDYLVNKKNK